MPRFIKMWLFSALISLTALGMWKGLEWYYSRGVEEDPPIVMTALDLALSYEQDASFSSLTYNGKDVSLSGIVNSIEEDGNQSIIYLDGNIYDIALIFLDIDEISKVETISNGDIITIEGTVEGLNIIYIEITDCSIK